MGRYQPPADVSEQETIDMIESFMNRPDIPLETDDRGYVEDIIRVEAVDMEWDIGMSIHQPEDPERIPTDADGQKVGILLLHGGSGDFKSMHEQADLLARKLGYKVVSMSFPGRHAFHTEGRDWPGRNVTTHDHASYSLELRTPIWKRGEHITRDQYDVIKDESQRPRYGIRTLAKAKPDTTFYHRMAGWPAAFEQGGIEAIEKHFPDEEFSVYVHGHSTGGPFVMMLSQRVPNVEGVLAIESSNFGNVSRAKHAWSGELGKIEGYERVNDETQLPPRTDPFDELYMRSWRDTARYVGPELLGQEGPEALMRLPMVMEDILDDWGDVQPRPQFKAEYIITHAIEDSLQEAAEVTAERMGLDKAETEELIERYIDISQPIEGPDADPIPPILFQIAAYSRDNSREVYEEVVIPKYEDVEPAPTTGLTQFGVGTHVYMKGEYADGVELGIGPAVFEQWHDAITGGFFVDD
jgi:pimeloyl-ACP methyl ester carboxylesterase